MMTGTITDDQAKAIAFLMASMRGWDLPGCRAAISKARHRAPGTEIFAAAARYVLRPEVTTPGLFHEDGPHWIGLPVAEARAPRPAKCPEHLLALRTDGQCSGCIADGLEATDQERALVRVAAVPTERVRQILADHGGTRPDPRAAAAGDTTPHYRED